MGVLLDTVQPASTLQPRCPVSLQHGARTGRRLRSRSLGVRVLRCSRVAEAYPTPPIAQRRLPKEHLQGHPHTMEALIPDLLEAEDGGTLPVPPVDKQACALLGPTALVVQALMAVLVLTSLLIKRFRE